MTTNYPGCCHTCAPAAAHPGFQVQPANLEALNDVWVVDGERFKLVQVRACLRRARTDGRRVRVGPAGSLRSDSPDSFGVIISQFHFHNPSEHEMHGFAVAAELHFVHMSASGRVAVFGIMFEEVRRGGIVRVRYAFEEVRGGGWMIAPAASSDAAAIRQRFECGQATRTDGRPHFSGLDRVRLRAERAAGQPVSGGMVGRYTHAHRQCDHSSQRPYQRGWCRSGWGVMRRV